MKSKQKKKQKQIQKRNHIRLGVNIDHCATLRQVRGGTTDYPDLLELARLAVAGGAEQITIHLREDRRHIQDNDVSRLATKRPALLNLEMAATAEMLKIALKNRPDWVCLVPEKRAELTTEGGLDLRRQTKRLGTIVQELQQKGIFVSAFIDADTEQVSLASKLACRAVEFHTGSWVAAKGQAKQRAWKRLCLAADQAHALGLSVHAGHGLDFAHTRLIAKLPWLKEVNIGHSIVCYALEMGMKTAVRKTKQCLIARSGLINAHL